MILRDVLKRGEEELLAAGVPEAGLNAWYLFSWCFAMERSEYFLQWDSEAEEEKCRKYRDMLALRKTRIPLEYITHETEFMGLTFYVDEHVLIPRQDTEILVEEVLAYSAGKDILDLCTGSGCIGISLAALGNCHSVTVSDLSEEALQIARKNALDNKAQVIAVQSDLFDCISGKFDIIVSNPPYIPSKEILTLMPEVRDHEPRIALDGETDGLSFYKTIIRESGSFLREKGMLVFEIGCDQGGDVSALMEQAGFQRIEIKRDLAGLNRVVRGEWSNKCG